MAICVKNSGISGLNNGLKGVFISFEGIDGVGKTTQVEALRDFLQARGLEVVVTREPGGTQLGKQLRDILLHGGAISARAEALLFAADRAQHAAQIIIPALQRGAVVITDRYIDSSLAYQSGGRELTMQDVRDLSEWASNCLWPNRTYLLDMSEQDAAVRLHGQADRMESAGLDFTRRTREAFLDLAKQNAQRFCVLDATLPACDLSKLIAKDVCELMDNAGIGDEKSPESQENQGF